VADKIITFGIPCYNSAEYMDHCIGSILEGSGFSDDIQIVIVDDGSDKDDTAAKADDWAARYPELIKVVHQQNGGHGMAVLAGLAAADGTYYKVVDSDDWLDGASLGELLDAIRTMIEHEEPIDLFVTRYVYEHAADDTRHSVGYTHILPENRPFTWHEIGHFFMSNNLLMHSLTYRTEMLRACNVPLPAHTFYVDNIYAWQPLPNCRLIYYVPVDLYHYFIGRDDQSVNERVMAGRIDQQVRITRIMMHCYHLYHDIKSVELRSYMVNYFVLMMAICSIFSRLSDHPDAMDELDRLWDELREYDPRLWRRCRFGIVGFFCNLPGRLGADVTMGGYHLASKFVKFN
jgi:glycosyltransferase involved in cell wall biosynthesis